MQEADDLYTHSKGIRVLDQNIICVPLFKKKQMALAYEVRQEYNFFIQSLESTH